MTKLDCNVKSNKRCKKCKHRMKQNYVNKYPDADECYSCDPKSKKNRPGTNPKKLRNKNEVSNG